ncbi:MAG TPA: transglycosylase domain-containing protein, partial [Candidatus Dormibacteraeota bacterium]|nr:transglycosylase domain-containing protein [Candidatus Dormibacteraeota bacterium]
MAENPPSRLRPARPVSRRAPAPRRPRRLLRSIALGLFALLVLAGLLGAVVAVGGFVLLSRGLPDPRSLETMAFTADSVVYDRTGTHELARFGTTNRQVVTYAQIPPMLIDATTAVEDKTFWTNSGFDPLAIVSAVIDTLRGNGRGASTITQQLVRQRLLDPAVVQDPGRTLERKAEELVQSIRVTEAFPGTSGKQRIITAYLNQNYYGNNDYGVMAAARDYFGVTDLQTLTLAQAAILAAIPQSPVAYDLVRNAVLGTDGRLVVPADRDIVQRRDLVLRLMEEGRTPLTGQTLTAADFERAMAEPVVLAPQTTGRWTAALFDWSVRDELTARLCGGAPTCPVLERGGLRILTTLDLRLQAAAERWVKAAAIVPNAKDPKAAAASIGVTYEPW